MKHTEIDNIALECVPIDLVKVEIYQGTVPCELLGAGSGGNGRGIEGVTKHTLTQRAPVLGDVTMDLSASKIVCFTFAKAAW